MITLTSCAGTAEVGRVWTAMRGEENKEGGGEGEQG